MAPISSRPAGFHSSHPNLIGLPKLSTVSTYAVHADKVDAKHTQKLFSAGHRPVKPVVSSQINALVSPTRGQRGPDLRSPMSGAKSGMAQGNGLTSPGVASSRVVSPGSMPHGVAPHGIGAQQAVGGPNGLAAEGTGGNGTGAGHVSRKSCTPPQVLPKPIPTKLGNNILIPHTFLLQTPVRQFI